MTSQTNTQSFDSNVSVMFSKYPYSQNSPYSSSRTSLMGLLEHSVKNKDARKKTSRFMARTLKQHTVLHTTAAAAAAFNPADYQSARDQHLDTAKLMYTGTTNKLRKNRTALTSMALDVIKKVKKDPNQNRTMPTSKKKKKSKHPEVFNVGWMI